MPTQTLTITWQGGSEQLAYGETYTADSLIGGGDYPIPAGSTNLEIDIIIPHTFSTTTLGLILLLLAADGALTIKTNSSGSPSDTIVTVANKPVLLRSGGAFPATTLSADVTKFFVTNATGSTVNLKVRGLQRLIP